MKMTKKEMFLAIRGLEAVSANADMVEFIDHEIELLNKKATFPRKPTATQVENENLKAKILVFLATVEEPVPIKKIQEGVADLAGLSNQKVSRLLKDLADIGKVEKTYIKKVAHFALALTDEVEA